MDITQQDLYPIVLVPGCELLSIWLLLWISHSDKAKDWYIDPVVNCFQFDYFCGYHTANCYDSNYLHWLWIAFNLITFVDITQQKPLQCQHLVRCELLSIWLLLWISHSMQKIIMLQPQVVNCFQFDYFCGYHTAYQNNLRALITLWIAFNLITFVDITQHNISIDIQTNSCELLSIWLLLWISHSLTSFPLPYPIVVNCFQFDYFCGYHTAMILFSEFRNELWIAFNLITFVDITQLAIGAVICFSRCELLSIWLLLWISHSLKWVLYLSNGVVNCFQFDYFCGYHTAS